jgi:hypothetical protein
VLDFSLCFFMQYKVLKAYFFWIYVSLLLGGKIVIAAPKLWSALEFFISGGRTEEVPRPHYYNFYMLAWIRLCGTFRMILWNFIGDIGRDFLSACWFLKFCGKCWIQIKIIEGAGHNWIKSDLIINLS